MVMRLRMWATRLGLTRADMRVKIVVEGCGSMSGMVPISTGLSALLGSVRSVLSDRTSVGVGFMFCMVVGVLGMGRVIVLVLYTCVACRLSSRGLLIRTFHEPLLGKILNGPWTCMLFHSRVPIQMPEDGIKEPFAIHRVRMEVFGGASRCLEHRKVDRSMGLIMVPPSTVASRHTSSPLGPWSLIHVRNSLLSLLGCVGFISTLYRSTMWIGRGDGTLMEFSVQESVVSVLVEDRLVGGVFEAEHGIAATSSNNATPPRFPGFLLLLHMAHIRSSHSTLKMGVHICD